MRPDIDNPTPHQIAVGRAGLSGEPGKIEWPDESRIEPIGQNGNTGEHYKFVDEANKPLVAPLSVQFLNRSASVQAERGRQYDKSPHRLGCEGKVERSFQKAARAFTAITGKHLRGSEVALLLQILKDVRQWQNPMEPHVDSLLDGVSYASLKAEEFMLEAGMETLP